MDRTTLRRRTPLISLVLLVLVVHGAQSFGRRQPPRPPPQQQQQQQQPIQPQQPPQQQLLRRSGLPALDSRTPDFQNNFSQRRIQNFPPPPHKFRGKPPFPFGRRRPPPPFFRNNYHRQPPGPPPQQQQQQQQQQNGLPPAAGQLLLPLPSNEPSQLPPQPQQNGPPQLSFHIPPAPPTHAQILPPQNSPQQFQSPSMPQQQSPQQHQQNNNGMMNNLQQQQGMTGQQQQMQGMPPPPPPPFHPQQNHQQQSSFANPILEYAPPPNSFNQQQQQQQQQQGGGGNKDSAEKAQKQTITFTVTPKPNSNGGNLIQFHISTPKPYKASLKSSSKEYYSGSTLRTIDNGHGGGPTPGYPNTEYRVSERDRERERDREEIRDGGEDQYVGGESYQNPIFVNKNPELDNKLETPFDNHYNGASIRPPPDFGPTNRPPPDFGPTNRLEPFGGPTNRPPFDYNGPTHGPPDFSSNRRPDFGPTGRPDYNNNRNNNGPTNRPDIGGPSKLIEFGGPTSGYGPTSKPDYSDFNPTNRLTDYGPTHGPPLPPPHPSGDYNQQQRPSEYHNENERPSSSSFNKGDRERERLPEFSSHHHSHHNHHQQQEEHRPHHQQQEEHRPHHQHNGPGPNVDYNDSVGERERDRDRGEGKGDFGPHGSSSANKNNYYKEDKYKDDESKYSQPDPLYHPEGDVVKSSEVRDMKPPPRFDNSYSSDYNKKDGSPPGGSHVNGQQMLHKQLAAEEVLAALGLSTNPLVSVPTDLSASGSNPRQEILTPPMPWDKSEYSNHQSAAKNPKQAEPLNLMDYLKLKEEEENGREPLLKANDKLVDSFVLSASMMAKPPGNEQLLNPPTHFNGAQQSVVFGRPLKNFGPHADSFPDSSSIESEKDSPSPSPALPLLHHLHTPIDRKDSLGGGSNGGFNSYIHQKLYNNGGGGLGGPSGVLNVNQNSQERLSLNVNPNHHHSNNMGHSMTASPPSSLYGPTAAASEIFHKLSHGPSPSAPSVPANFIPPQRHSLYAPPSPPVPPQVNHNIGGGYGDNHVQSNVQSLLAGVGPSLGPSYIPIPQSSYPPLVASPPAPPGQQLDTTSYIQQRLNGNPLAGIPPPPPQTLLHQLQLPSQKLYEPLYEASGNLESGQNHGHHGHGPPTGSSHIDRYAHSVERGDIRDGGLLGPGPGMHGPPPPQGHGHHEIHNNPHFNDHERIGHGHGHGYEGPFSATPRYGEPYPVYVTEPDPIIEIIVQDSNVTLPPLPTHPPPPPPLPPTPEPVHVFYVRYSQNKSYDSHYDGSEQQIKLETPVASIPVRGPNRDLEVDGGGHSMQHSHIQLQQPQQPPSQQQQQHQQNIHQYQQHLQQQQQQQQQPILTTTESPSTTTTLRTVIRPDKNEYTPSKLGVAFDHPPEIPMFQDLAQQQSQQILNQFESQNNPPPAQQQNTQFQQQQQQNAQPQNTQQPNNGNGNFFQFQQQQPQQNINNNANNNAFQQVIQNIINQQQQQQLHDNQIQQHQQQQQQQQNNFQQQQQQQQNNFQSPFQFQQSQQHQNQQQQHSSPFDGNPFQQQQQNSGEPQQNQFSQNNPGQENGGGPPQDELITFPQLSNQDLSQLDKLWTESVSSSSSSSSHEYKPSPVYNFNRRMGLQELASLLDAGEDNGNTNSGQETSTESPKLPEDVPMELKQQLVNSGILGNADVQVINFDENLFKELSDLPPEALTALSNQYPSLEKSKRSVKNILILKNSQRPKRTNRSRRLVMIVTETDSFIYNPRKKYISRVSSTSVPVQRALELSHHHHY